MGSLCRRQKSLFMHYSCTVYTLKNIKNGSHDTIYTFKNYFATILSVFSFNNNKLNPNGPILEVRHNFGSWKKRNGPYSQVFAREYFSLKLQFLCYWKWRKRYKSQDSNLVVRVEGQLFSFSLLLSLLLISFTIYAFFTYWLILLCARSWLIMRIVETLLA